MIIKKAAAVIICLATVLSLTACKDNKNDDISAESSTNTVIEKDYINAPDSPEPTTDSLPAENTDSAVTSPADALPVEPSEWTTAMIVEAYKAAAEKSAKTAKSSQKITLTDISINNGQFEGVMKVVTPIMSKLLANNSTETTGITGGYSGLTESDVREAKAYKSGNNTVIEMVMHEQTDGAHSDAKGGSVGHAISVVGNIDEVTAQLTDLGLPMEVSEENTTIRYTNPVVKVVIDSNGNIIRGTWSYTVEIRLDDYKVSGKPVETTSVVMENVITVNGGFSK